MSLLPFAECARQLGVHPKTLRTYLKRAEMSLTPHPTDARIKCLTDEQVHQLAELFGRQMTSPVPQPKATPQSQAQTLPAPDSCPPADLIARLSVMEQQVRTLSEHVAALAMTLLAERERTVEHRLSMLEHALYELKEPSDGSPPLPEPKGAAREEAQMRSSRSLYPAEQRARSRMPVLIEYSSKQGRYIIASSLEGELLMTPSSPNGLICWQHGVRFADVGTIWSVHCVPRVETWQPDTLLDRTSLHSPAALQISSRRDRSFDNCLVGASSC